MNPETTITDLPLASGIDASADWFAIDRTSLNTTQRINRNTMLGIAGAPVGTTDSQTLTNKVITSPTLTVLDNAFTLQDNSDPTKQAQFQLSGITTGQIRTLTLPNASVTLSSLTGTETLTNKTLTAPVINNGSITGTTITTDAIVGQTSATNGTVYGLTVTGGAIGAAGLQSNAVTTAKIADSAVTPAKLLTGTGSSWVWQSWVPTYTNLSGGTTTFAQFIQVGKTVFYRLLYTLAGANVSGSVTFTLPTTSAGYSPQQTYIGTSTFTDTGSNQFNGLVRLETTTTGLLLVTNVGGTYATASTISSSIPHTWAATDILSAQGFYEAA